ncbi:MAG TPA: 3-dehydroquinate synthase [Candidatus Polarisedimenticolaceae bacterium]
MRRFLASVPASSRRRIPVAVGAGALARLEDDLERSAAGRLVVVVSDSNVAPLHGVPLVGRLRGRGLRAELVDFPAGEVHKTRETKAAIEDRLAAFGADRSTLLVALGGGVTGDVAGFVAATWLRGVEVVQAPTSLLAMADAALGGKTGVDVPAGKNLVGAFHQPSALYADVELLATLPDADFRNGFAEIVKSAVVGDAAAFARLERDASALARRRAPVVERTLAACLRLKARIVARDEREAGVRMILNFGHTAAHAVEAASGYAVSHGEAVAIGMTAEGRIAVEAVGFPAEDAARVERLLARLGLPLRAPAGTSREELLAAMARDKKNLAGLVRCALPRAIGRMGDAGAVATVVDAERLADALRGD